MQRILLVDDDQNVLNALRHELAKTYEVEIFPSPLEALGRAKGTDFAVVVSDYCMPEMDGVAFLENFRQLQPDAVRLILSGQADMEALIKAINITHIYRFLPKPTIIADLKSAIAQALDFREAMLENRRYATAYRQHFGAPPQVEERKLYRVLLVSPDENTVTSMWRELTHRSSYEGLYGAMRYGMTRRPSCGGQDFQLLVDSVASPPEALEFLRNKDCDLVIADYTLPGMDGVAFLRELRQSGVDSACVLVGDSLDLFTLADAINQAHIDSFLKRSWNGYELKCTVAQTLSYRDLVRENRNLAELLRGQAGPVEGMVG